MDKLNSKKDITFLTLICSIVYFVSYVSRINLGAVLVEVIHSGYAPRSTAALALTVCSITYGAGQLVSGYLGDKFKPHNIIFTGFLVTATVNILVGTIGNGSVLVLLWAINGFAQSLMWPPLVKIMASKLDSEAYKKACVKVSWGSSCGTIGVYLFAPLFIKVYDVRLVFIVSGVLAVLTGIVWKCIYDRYKPFAIRAIPSVSKTASEGTEKQSFEKMTSPVFVLLFGLMVAILMQGALRDGVTNWAPTYISEMFNLDSTVSILTGVILPVFSILSFSAVSFINRRLIKNEIVCAGAIFFVGALSAILLRFFGGQNVVVSLVLLALLVGSMHGVNLILVCMTPASFARFGKVSFISGMINSCTYVGAAVSTYGIAVFTEKRGWDMTIILWAVVALLGTGICLASSKGWKKLNSK